MDATTILAPGPLALLGYTLGLNALVSAYKMILRLACERAGARLRRALDVVEIFNSQASTFFGALSGPLVVPWLFEVFGSTAVVPLSSAIFTGAAAGAMSSTLWDLFHRVIKRLIRSGGAPDDSEVA